MGSVLWGSLGENEKGSARLPRDLSRHLRPSFGHARFAFQPSSPLAWLYPELISWRAHWSHG